MRYFISIAMILFAAQVGAVEPSPPRSAKANLTILADEALMLPLARLTRLYATDSNTPVTLALKQPDVAEQQIEQGLEAHLLITADDAMMDRLSHQGVTDVSSRKPLAQTALALVAVRTMPLELNPAERLSLASILAATRQIPIYYSSEGVEGLRVRGLKPRAEFQESLTARLQPLSNADELTTVLRDEKGLGLMLATQAVAEGDMHILGLLPETLGSSLTYEMVVLGSESMAAATALQHFLASEEAQKTLRDLGYQVP
jgi:ABC-type molybdate transport system substrate-binding protein